MKYLQSKQTIKVCTNPDWAPIEFLNKNTPEGISIDTLNIIASKLLNFRTKYL